MLRRSRGGQTATQDRPAPAAAGDPGLAGLVVHEALGALDGVWTVCDGADGEGRHVRLWISTTAAAQDPELRGRAIRLATLRATPGADEQPLAPLAGVGLDAGRLVIARRVLTGPTLADLLADGPLVPEEAVRMLSPVAGALGTLHAFGIPHDHLTPDGVRLTEDGAALEYYGFPPPVVRSRTDDSVLEVADFLAPEVARGAPAGMATDVYALACVLVTCLTGAPPFQADRPLFVVEAHRSEPPPHIAEPFGLPSELDDVLQIALAKRPEQRHASATELMTAVQAALGLAPQEIPELRPLPPEEEEPAAEPEPEAEAERVETGRRRRRTERRPKGRRGTKAPAPAAAEDAEAEAEPREVVAAPAPEAPVGEVEAADAEADAEPRDVVAAPPPEAPAGEVEAAEAEPHEVVAAPAPEAPAEEDAEMPERRPRALGRRGGDADAAPSRKLSPRVVAAAVIAASTVAGFGAAAITSGSSGDAPTAPPPKAAAAPPNRAMVAAVDRAIEPLAEARVDGRWKLQSAKTPLDQGAAARQLARAYRDARLALPPRTNPAVPRTLGAIEQDYRRLSRAAVRSNAPAFRDAARDIAAQERRLDGLLRRLGQPS